MPNPDPRQRLMYIAGAMSVLCGIVLVVLIIRGSQSNGAQQAADSDAPDGMFEPLINQDATAGAGGGSGLFIQVTDKDDPTRVAMELRSVQMDPIGADLYRVDTPRAWVFMKDGASVYITAAEGTLLLPDRAREPEEGTLTGGVVIRRYPDLGRRADPDSDEPEATFTSQTLTFDLQFGEVSTPDRIVVTSRLGELVGTDMRMTVNEPLERIEIFRLRQGEYLRIKRSTQADQSPAGKPAAAEETVEQVVAEASPETQAPATDADQPKVAQAPASRPSSDLLESFYRAVFQDNVVLVDRGRTIKGDQLELWTRLVDNQLAPDAIGDGSGDPIADERQAQSGDVNNPLPAGAVAMTDSDPSADRSVDAPVDAAQPGDRLASADPQAAPADTDILLTWTGVAEIVPVITRPAELSEDEVAARFTASVTGRVLLNDPTSNARASTGLLEYYATRRHIVMASPGMTGVELVSEGNGLARFGRFELNLATGIGFAPGAGLVENPDATGTVTWNEQADLVFAVDDRGITGVLQEAMCSGAVRARRDNSTLESEFLRTVFVPDDKGDLKLTRLAARGQVKVSDGRDAGGTCQSLDVLFDPLDPREDPTPTDLVARGNARFNDGEDRIEAEIIDAALKQDDTDDGVAIQRLHTMGATRISRARDNLVVSGGDVLMYDDRQTVRIQGPNALAQRDGVRITAAGPDDVIDLDATGRNAAVTGAGSFSRSARNPDGTTGSLDASWSTSMAFDDFAGTLHCVGDVRAVHAPDPTRRDVVIGREVTATFEPFQSPDPDLAHNENKADREVRTFIAHGEGTSTATVESARYEIVDGAEPRLARAMRISGPTVALDQTRGIVEVPGPGSLLISDQRQNLPEGRQALARFQWTNSFVHDRNTSRATMLGNVKTAHKRTADAEITLIDCDNLYAVIVDAQQAGLDDPAAGEAQLKSARAEGNVLLRSGTREALAGSMDYDAANATASLRGTVNGYVTIIDAARTGVPTKAGRILWDLNRDRIDILDAGPFRGSP